MKNISKLLLLLVSFTLITACSSSSKVMAPSEGKSSGRSTPENNSNAGSNPIKGITVNKIKYEEVKIQDLKPELKSFYDSKKAYKGFVSYKDKDDYWYIGIFSGKKKTGGYGIKVLHVEDIEGQTGIVVEETSPKPSTIVTQALTYPYTVIKTKGVVGPIVVKNTAGEEFKDLSKAGKLID